MSVGVIVAVGYITDQEAAEVREELERRFPGVTFAVIASATSSVAFEWNESTKQAPPIPSKLQTGPR